MKQPEKASRELRAQQEEGWDRSTSVRMFKEGASNDDALGFGGNSYNCLSEIWEPVLNYFMMWSFQRWQRETGKHKKSDC